MPVEGGALADTNVAVELLPQARTSGKKQEPPTATSA